MTAAPGFGPVSTSMAASSRKLIEWPAAPTPGSNTGQRHGDIVSSTSFQSFEK
jgi:hypothetical protein